MDPNSRYQFRFGSSSSQIGYRQHRFPLVRTLSYCFILLSVADPVSCVNSWKYVTFTVSPPLATDFAFNARSSSLTLPLSLIVALTFLTPTLKPRSKRTKSRNSSNRLLFSLLGHPAFLHSLLLKLEPLTVSTPKCSYCLSLRSFLDQVFILLFFPTTANRAFPFVSFLSIRLSGSLCAKRMECI